GPRLDQEHRQAALEKMEPRFPVPSPALARPGRPSHAPQPVPPLSPLLGPRRTGADLFAPSRPQARPHGLGLPLASTTTLLPSSPRQLLAVVAGEPHLSQRLCSACSPPGGHQDRGPEDGSRLRLIDGRQAPRPLDLCHPSTGQSVTRGCLFFLG